MRDLRFSLALFSTAIRASLALRAAFLLQAGLMVINNLIFFSTWWILLDRFGSIGGYTVADMLALFGVSVGGYGVAVVLCGNLLELARSIEDGELDALLSQPKSVLLRALSSRSLASGWGDVITGAGMLIASGYVSWARAPLALLAVAIAAAMYVASAVVLHSSAFWLGHVQGVTRILIDFVITFSFYPPALFGPAIKVVLFTLLPAGLIAFLPVELVRDFNARTALLALGGAALYAGFARALFARGLRRYTSGSRFVTGG
jgi:ABC-2 type transport system permease protein